VGIVRFVIGKTKFSPFEFLAIALNSIFFLGKSRGSIKIEYGAPVSTPCEIHFVVPAFLAKNSTDRKSLEVIPALTL
jgi:hypothetical protein